MCGPTWREGVLRHWLSTFPNKTCLSVPQYGVAKDWLHKCFSHFQPITTHTALKILEEEALKLMSWDLSWTVYLKIVSEFYSISFQPGASCPPVLVYRVGGKCWHFTRAMDKLLCILLDLIQCRLWIQSLISNNSQWEAG